MTINPAMIALARESRGWTQKDLGDAIGFTQSAIAKFELGANAPDERTIAAIASALNYHPSFFSQGDVVHGLGSSFLFHRQRARIPMRVQTRVQAEVNVRRLQVAQLLKAATSHPDYEFPRISTADFRGSPERVAREVRELWSLPEGPVQDLTRTIEDAGGIVVLVPFETHQIDGVHMWLPGLPPLFFMNQNVPGERHRFNLAHEIGHAVMHNGLGAALDDIEEEANRFASEFLMPKDDVRSDLARMNLDTAARLKPVWKVSMQALIRRARDVGQLTEANYRRLFTVLSARGERIDEPYPIELEKPVVFDALVKVHRERLQIDDEGMERMLFTSRLGPLPPPSEKPELRLVGGLFGTDN